jgi:hypothetical protein
VPVSTDVVVSPGPPARLAYTLQIVR